MFFYFQGKGVMRTFWLEGYEAPNDMAKHSSSMEQCSLKTSHTASIMFETMRESPNSLSLTQSSL